MAIHNINTQEFLDKITRKGEITGEIARLDKTFVSPEDTVRTVLENSVLREEIATFVRRFFASGRFLKSRESSEKYRSEGNNFFSGPSPKLSLKYFTHAVKYAPISSNESRLAFGNRSAVLFLMEEYEKSLQDIEFALCDEQNFERQIKLLVRKGKCYSQLRKFKEASEVFNIVKEMLQLLKSTELTPRLQNLSRETENGLEKIEDMRRSRRSGDSKERETQLPLPAYGHNPDLPYASAALKVSRSPEKGRFITAKHTIQTGDVLFVEKPFAFVILPICSSTHCHNCCTTVLNPLPCESCAEASFCTEKCREDAWERYHRWECGPGLDLSYSLGIAHLAMRLAIVGSASKSPKYTAIKNLVSHLEKIQPSDLYQFTVTATMMSTYLLTCTDFFDSHKGCNFFSLSASILNHIGQLICNGHAITGLSECNDVGEEVYSEERIRIATAIFPSASMMNHSCDANIMNSFCGQYLIVKASRDIPATGEVFNSYGPHYRRMGWTDRQRCLREQYKFKCECEPCTNPTKKEFHQRFFGFLCNHCTGPVLLINKEHKTFACVDCRRVQSVTHIEKYLVKADNLCSQGDRAMGAHNLIKALSKYLKSLNFKEAILYKHHTGIRECKDKIAKCFAILGKYEESYDYVEDTILGVEAQFGECSSEFVYEVLKLSDICCKICETLPLTYDQRMIVKKTQMFMDKAMTAVDVLFGQWHANYKELVTRDQNFSEILSN